ncbi:MAG: YfiR family protein [Rhodocyclaceae bacterium]|nr:YfiR family protein [Rhodocyclaceae bacterium]
MHGLVLAVLALAGNAMGAAVDEAQVKAAFVFNLVRYVDWPEGALPPGAPLTVCRAGSGALSAALSVLEGRQAGGRQIRVRSVEGDPAGCQVLVLADGDGNGLLSRAQGRPILTIGEGWGFLEESGIVALVVLDGKLVFGANMDAARRANLRLSAQLLKLARRVLDGAGK